MKNISKKDKEFIKIVRKSLINNLKKINWNDSKQLKYILIEVEELEFHLKNKMKAE